MAFQKEKSCWMSQMKMNYDSLFVCLSVYKVKLAV